MQRGASLFKFIWITLTQSASSRKCLALIFLLTLSAAAALCAEAGLSSSVDCWSAGWRAWKADDCETALREWSRGSLFNDFRQRPARSYYWRARALDKLGRAEESQKLKTELARKYPFDYYTFLIFPNGGISAYPAGIYGKMAAVFYPRPWPAAVYAAALRTGVSAELIWAVMRRESKFKRRAVSKAGAVGLMQLMPATAEETAEMIRLTADENDLCRPERNVLLGASYITLLIRKFNGDLPRALAAYNAGASNIVKWDMLTARDWVEWVEEIPYAQTREYVRSVLENMEIYMIISGSADGRGLAQLAPRQPEPLKVSAWGSAAGDKRTGKGSVL